MTHRIIETTDKLMRAFFKGTLKHGGIQPNYTGCAVCEIEGSNAWIGRAHSYKPLSGYTMQQLMMIEGKFEGRKKPLSRNFVCTQLALTDKDSFKGLTAVFDLLVNDIDADFYQSEGAKVNILEPLKEMYEEEICSL